MNMQKQSHHTSQDYYLKINELIRLMNMLIKQVDYAGYLIKLREQFKSAPCYGDILKSFDILMAG